MIKDITVFRQCLCGGETGPTSSFTDQHRSPGAVLGAARAPVSASVRLPHKGPHRATTLKSHQGGQLSFFNSLLFSVFLSVRLSLFSFLSVCLSVFLSFLSFFLSHTYYSPSLRLFSCRIRSGGGSNKSAIKARVLWGDSRQ